MKIIITACILLASRLPAVGAVHVMNAAEMKLFQLVLKDKGQNRPVMELDPILCRAARGRAEDMFARNYYGHTTPDGKGPNRIIRRAGYLLPEYYSQDKEANNIESIASGPIAPTQALSLWKKSEFHRPHLLGEHPFYQEQNRIGIGIVGKKGSAIKYFVFISAPDNQNPSPPHWVLKDPHGKIISDTGSNLTVGSFLGGLGKSHRR